MASSVSDCGDRELNLLAARCFVGTARVDIPCLGFLEGREIDNRIVQDLVTSFEQTRCRRYEQDNFIPVLISTSNLTKALRASNISRADLRTTRQEGTFRHLKPAKNQKFSGVHGRHRIKAAEQFLDASDWWWPVKLFQVDSKGTTTAPDFDHAD